MPQTFREKDSQIEKEVSKFLDRHLYCGDIIMRRCVEKKLQTAGIDGYLSIPSLGIDNALADEKAGIHHVNVPIDTYLMEISQVNKFGDIVDGWFLDDKSVCEYYVLIYLWANVPAKLEDNKVIHDWTLINANNITMAEYYVVKKTDAYDYLASCGFPKERLRSAADWMRTHEDTDRIKTTHGFKFVISRKFKECPVNVCIDKSVYNKIAKLHGYVGKYDYAHLTKV